MISTLILSAFLSMFGGPIVADTTGGVPTVTDVGGGIPTAAVSVDDVGGGIPTH